MPTMTKFQTYGVLYYEKDNQLPADAPLIFLCEAEDTEHAEEQCTNTYPGCTIMWVTQTDSNRELEQIEQTYEEYYA